MKKQLLFLASVAFALVANAQNYVDLGLPSGTVWATTNLGASTPEECGGYYAWGETQTKSVYNITTYKWVEEGTTDLMMGWMHINKYTIADGQTSCDWYDGNTFIGDGEAVLAPEDDAAAAIWGGKWHMPTYVQMKELVDLCTWTITDGLATVTGPNGKSIILPVAGCYTASVNNGAMVTKKGSEAFYMTKELTHLKNGKINDTEYGRSDVSCVVRISTMWPDNRAWGNGNRECGYSIRPVMDKAPGETIRGDVNEDGRVDIADVNEVINIILGKN